MKDRLKVVLDTNVLLVSISSRSKYHWIYDKLLADEYDLFVTNEISSIASFAKQFGINF